MKKTMSCTLAATLAISPINGFANEVVKVDNKKENTVRQIAEITGKLEIDINFALPIINSKSNDMKVKLMGTNITEGGEIISLTESNGETSLGMSYSIEKLDSEGKSVSENEKVSFIRIVFNNAPIGEYSFELSGSGYKTVTVDNIDITSYSKRVKIGTQENEVVKSYGETEDKNTYEKYPALFLAGDVNIDNIIDMNDYKIVLDDIKSNSKKYDLNKDSKTDISDLSYIKSSIGSESKIPTDRSYILNTDPIINPDNVAMQVEEGVTVNGQSGPEALHELKELLKSGTSSVAIGNPEVAPTTEKPTKIGMDLSSNSSSRNANGVEIEQVTIKSPSASSNENAGAPETGYIEYKDENENILKKEFDKSNVKMSRDGSSQDIVIDLGSQIAVKEISINVTGNRGNKNISEIAKIEFLNNVYKEIPKPVISIPTIKTLETSTNKHDERITISWEKQPNVTGYEVKYFKLNDKGEKVGPVKTLQTNKTNINILDKAISPYDTFRVSIQSLNGEWKSGYAEDLVGIDPDKGGLTPEKQTELIPNELDGKPDNVDENFNLKDEYYGTGKYEGKANMGSVSDIQVVPICKPEPPRNLSISEGYKSLSVSWENHIQAREFDVYYRKIGSDDKRWIKANDKSVGLVNENDQSVTNPDKSKLVRRHSYMIDQLDDEASYEIRTTATNHLGTSKMSETYLGTTKTLNPPKTSNYKLINKPKNNYAEGESPVEGIKDIKYPNSSSHPNGVDKFTVVDNDYTTYWMSGKRSTDGPIIEFENQKSIGEITFVTRLEHNYVIANIWDGLITVKYEDENGQWKSLVVKEKENNDGAHHIKLPHEIKTNKIQLSYQVSSFAPAGYQSGNMTEIKVYEYDSLENDVSDLFEDEFRIKLKEHVNQNQIDELRKRVNTMDKYSNEYHPNRTNIMKNLDEAQQLLIDSASLENKIVTLDPNIKTNHGGVSLGMGNDWQSLGAVARPAKDDDGQEEELVVYMGRNTNTTVELAFLQTYGQPGSYIKTYKLSSGRNEIRIPKIISENVEKGGQVMARVVNGNPNTQVKIRLGNVTQIPHLNVNNIINDKSKESEVKDKIRVYIRDLKKHVANLPNMYREQVTDQDRLNNIYTYEETTSVLNNTDIEGDRFTLTMPATQILKGIESGINANEEAQVERVYNALLAWEQQMQLTYAKKGVYESVDNAPSQEEYEKHKAPQTRMNIKYQRMIMGAAGYASSHHVGVGYGGVANYMRGVPFKFDENKNVVNPQEARLYGDLIAHEIGHVTDIGSRVYPETSNNLTVSLASSMLNQNPTKPGNIYPQLYEKVTSHTLGLSTNRSVVLGMLWQPYLAYEDEDTYKMLFTDNDKDPNNDSYFAKLNRVYRTLTEEETKNADRDQLLIRVSSKVVGKDLSAFYYAHGIMPNVDTIKYVSQFPKEERPIQYINDEARRQRLAGNATMSSDTKLVANFGQDNKGNQILDKSYVNQDRVPINLSVTKDSDKILGYEIIRNGKSVGFVNANKNGLTTYSDIVDNVNNRVFNYEAVAYDYNLNATDKIELGTIKVRHDGSVNKSNIDISSNTIPLNESDYDKHSDNQNKTLINAIDNDSSSIYEGKVHNYACNEHNHEENKQPDHSKDDAYIILDANEERSLAGIKYTAPKTTTKLFKKEKLSKSAIQKFEIQISKDGKNWTKVKEGQFKLDSQNPTETIYFDKAGTNGGNQLNVYNTRFIKLIAKGSNQISVSELDLIAPPGDNIEIGVASDNINYKNGLGILKEEYIYQPANTVPDNPNTEEDESKERKIPKGSVIITGEYRGNPAFNVPLVLNENEKHIADKYKGILMAEVPNNGDLEEISKGNWVYWVEPQYVNQFMKNKEVFAELYRTDTADGQSKGQRLVSDTFKVDVPDQLPEISLSSNNKKTLKESKKNVIEIDSNLIKEIRNNR